MELSLHDIEASPEYQEASRASKLVFVLCHSSSSALKVWNIQKGGKNMKGSVALVVAALVAGLSHQIGLDGGTISILIIVLVATYLGFQHLRKRHVRNRNPQ